MKTILLLLCCFTVAASAQTKDSGPVHASSDATHVLLGQTGATVTFAYDFEKSPDFHPVRFGWIFERFANGEPAVYDNGTKSTASHRFVTPGSYVVLLIAGDAKGETRNFRIGVRIQPPVEFFEPQPDQR
ncbi:MAG TPA: hypothetical protein VHX11_07835 [Acidobacteriaceae bacterium]|jgi:hypothetical protein|nr:hypothetical protein [Acidobacteriaceae bacterium]